MKPLITINLSVAKVHSGGNTGQGKYFYSFDQDVILVTEPDTEVRFQLSGETASAFTIRTVITSDSKMQLGSPKHDPNKRWYSMINACKVAELITLAIVVQDHSDPSHVVSFVCDPQVLCEPVTPPIP